MFGNRNKIKYGPYYIVLIEMHEDRKGRERETYIIRMVHRKLG